MSMRRLRCPLQIFKPLREQGAGRGRCWAHRIGGAASASLLRFADGDAAQRCQPRVAAALTRTALYATDRRVASIPRISRGTTAAQRYRYQAGSNTVRSLKNPTRFLDQRDVMDILT